MKLGVLAHGELVDLSTITHVLFLQACRHIGRQAPIASNRLPIIAEVNITIPQLT